LQHQHQRGAPAPTLCQGGGDHEPAEPAAEPAAWLQHPETTIKEKSPVRRERELLKFLFSFEDLNFIFLVLVFLVGAVQIRLG